MIARMLLRAALVTGLSVAWSSPAAAQSWQAVTQPGGYKVARITMAGAATGIAITCNGTNAVIAVSLARPPQRNSARLTMRSGSLSATLGIVRVGGGNVWAAVVRDPRVLDMLASGQSVALSVDGADYGAAPLAGANAAMAVALTSCWRPQVAGAPTGGPEPGRDSAPAPAAFDNKPMAVADTSSPESVQTSFPTRDAKTGKPRLPVRLGAYIKSGTPCAKIAETDRVFIDVGGGAGVEGAGQGGASSDIKTIRLVKPGTYATHELIAVQDTAEGDFTYVVANSENFSVSGRDYSGTRWSGRYSFCSQASLPIADRQFLASEHRRIAALPILPGYYRFWSDFGETPKFSCEAYCGYALISPAGFAMATKSDQSRGKVDRNINLFTAITQTAPFDYLARGRTESDSKFFTINNPSKFSESDGEGTINYERIDPARIPPAMMPRF